jgi:hypothetical protein
MATARASFAPSRDTPRVSQLRAARRMLMAEHCATTGKPNTGRQWRKLRKAVRRAAA